MAKTKSGKTLLSIAEYNSNLHRRHPEKFDFSNNQKERLNKMGNVTYFDKASDDDINKIISDADVVLLDWIDPSDIIMPRMKKGSFICLPFTGFAWIVGGDE